MRVKYKAIFSVLDQYLAERGFFRKCRLKARENELIRKIRESLSKSSALDSDLNPERYVDTHFWELLQDVAKEAAKKSEYHFSVNGSEPASARALVRIFLLYVEGYFEPFDREAVAKSWFGQKFSEEFADIYRLSSPSSSNNSRRSSEGSSETAISEREDSVRESMVFEKRHDQLDAVWQKFVRLSPEDFPAMVETKDLLGEFLKLQNKFNKPNFELESKSEWRSGIDRPYFRKGLGLLRLQEPELLRRLAGRWFLSGDTAFTEKLALFPLPYLVASEADFLNKFDPESLTPQMLYFLSKLEGLDLRVIPEKFLTEKALEILSALGASFLRHYLADLSEFSGESLIKYGPQLIRYFKDGHFERESPANLFRALNEEGSARVGALNAVNALGCH